MDINETIIRKFHPHPFGFLIFYFSGIVLFVVSFWIQWQLSFIGVLVFVLGEVARRAETFYIMESGVAREYRLLATSRDFTQYQKIQNLFVRQSFIENILGIGSIHIDTAGGDKTEVNFNYIKHPYSFERIIRDKMKMH